VETPRGRIAYSPVSSDAVPGLFQAGFLECKPQPLCLGVTDEIDWLKRQEGLTFARCGITDPLSISDYVQHGGYRGLANALERTRRES
jgi:formate dehydrogenase iron-sulfur subunit